MFPQTVPLQAAHRGLAGEPLPRVGDRLRDAFWRIDPRPDGCPAPDGPYVNDFEDKFELVASGQALVITAGVPGIPLRPGLTAIPLHGVEPSQVALATRAGDNGRLLAAFRKSAQALLGAALSRGSSPGPSDSCA